MNVESLFRQLNISYDGQNTSISTALQNSQQLSLQKGLEHILNSTNGQVLSGQVVSVDGENIVLSLPEGELLNARLESAMNPSLGQLLSFEVKGNQGGTVSLAPLFTNTTQELTVNNALSAANMPQSAQNQYMVKSMMEEGLPIDKSSLYSMSQAMQTNATADVLDLAKMTRLNIPLTPEMVEEFNAYQNFEHEITNALSDIGEAFADSVSQAFEVMPFEKALEFVDVSSQALFEFESSALTQEDTPAIENNSSLTTNENSVELKLENNVLVMPEEELFSNEEVNDFVPRNVARSIIRDARELGLPNEVIEDAKNDILTPGKLVKSIINSIKDTDITSLSKEEAKSLSEHISKLFENEDFKDILKKEISNRFLLKPEEVAEDGKVSKLYERMTNEIHKLSQSVSELGVKESPLQNSVNNLSMNVDFMNELNQTFNYVQIPLKLNQSQTTGELYVYSNKKSLSKDDGNVSALLHLDMEHLGPVDVHVSLNENNNVKTKFFLKEDSVLDLIADNIDILNKRLEKRGYSMSTEFVNNEKKTSVLDSILEDNKNISIVSSGRFDARA